MPELRKHRINLPMNEGTGEPLDLTSRGNDGVLQRTAGWGVDASKGNVVDLEYGTPPANVAAIHSVSIAPDASWRLSSYDWRMAVYAKPQHMKHDTSNSASCIMTCTGLGRVYVREGMYGMYVWPNGAGYGRVGRAQMQPNVGGEVGGAHANPLAIVDSAGAIVEEAASQGIAYHDGFYYVTWGTLAHGILRKVDATTGLVVAVSVDGNAHYGDPTVYDGKVYVPASNWNGSAATTTTIEVFDPAGAPATGWTAESQADVHAALVALAGQDNENTFLGALDYDGTNFYGFSHRANDNDAKCYLFKWTAAGADPFDAVALENGFTESFDGMDWYDGDLYMQSANGDCLLHKFDGAYTDTDDNDWPHTTPQLTGSGHDHPGNGVEWSADGGTLFQAATDYVFRTTFGGWDRVVLQGTKKWIRLLVNRQVIYEASAPAGPTQAEAGEYIALGARYGTDISTPPAWGDTYWWAGLLSGFQYSVGERKKPATIAI